MQHFLFTMIDVPWEVKRVLAFPQMFRFDPGSSIKQNTNNIFYEVQFDTADVILMTWPEW